jgi:tetratricopeptide (TPR) repeat protein
MQSLLGERSRVLPLRIVLTGGRLFANLRPAASSAAFYQSSAEADWIVVSWDNPDSERALAHEMVHATLEHAGPRRPLWLEEGLAEFYSTAARQGDGWRIGQPVAGHVRLLRSRDWMGEEEFFGLQPDSPERDENRRAGLFYAQSWAVVHFLLTAPSVRTRAAALFEALGEGVAMETACQEKLGLPAPELLARAKMAVRSGNFSAAIVAGQQEPGARGAVEAMTEEETTERLLMLALAAGRPSVARDMAGGTSSATRGLLALANGDRSATTTLLEQAVAEGDASAAAHFELAMLLRETGNESARVESLLRATLRLQPSFAEAHFLLGLGASARQDHEVAIESFQTAARILPRHANFWHALAIELQRAGRIPEARHAAQRCRTAARNQAEREMAAALEGLFAPATAAAKSTAPVRTPESWQGLRGESTAAGEFLEFDCTAAPPRMRVRTPAGVLRLEVARPGEIHIRGGSEIRYTFTCGPQSGRVRVEYRADTLELTALEFLP